MLAERLGSYSMVSTFPVTPILSRRKSIIRYRRLCPPPRWRTERRPRLSRPPLLGLGASRGLWGAFSELSRSTKVAKRRPALVGLLFLTGIVLPRSLT